MIKSSDLLIFLEKTNFSSRSRFVISSTHLIISTYHNIASFIYLSTKHNSFIEALRSFFRDSNLKRRFQREIINDDHEKLIIEILRQLQ